MAALQQALAGWPQWIETDKISLLDLLPLREWRDLIAKTNDARGTEPQSRLHRLARVAQLYSAGVAHGQRHINVAIAKKLGRSASQVRDDVYAARREDLLTAGGGHGRQAGSLTKKARELLEEDRR